MNPAGLKIRRGVSATDAGTLAETARAAMATNSNLPRLTKGQRDALAKIAVRQGTFHKVVGDRIEHAGLAFPVSGILNFLANCNSRSADGWALTELGAACVR